MQAIVLNVYGDKCDVGGFIYALEPFSVELRRKKLRQILSKNDAKCFSSYEKGALCHRFRFNFATVAVDVHLRCEMTTNRMILTNVMIYDDVQCAPI